MAKVHPFPAFRYNPDRVTFDRVLTQPYDKISPAVQEQYYAADPHNLIAVEKGRVFPVTPPPGWKVKKRLHARGRRIAKLDPRTNRPAGPRPCFYSYSQEYTVPGTRRQTERGNGAHAAALLARVRLEEYSAGIVFRHEHTLSGPKADRLELLRHTQTHTGQLFLLYSDAERVIDKILAQAESEAAPATELTDEYNVIHRLWVVWQPERIAAIHKAMADQKLVIADGHHRYETALNYRNERRKEAARTGDLPDRAEAQDATASSPSLSATTPSPSLAAAAGAAAAQMAAAATEHVEGASASVATATAASLAAGSSPSNDGARLRRSRALRSCHDDLRQHPQRRPYHPPNPPRRRQHSRLLLGHRPPLSRTVVRRRIFTFSSDAEKSAARDKFLKRLVAARESARHRRLPRARSRRQRRLFYVLTLRPGANLALLLPNVSPLQRELDVVLLHDGILEPALGVTLAAATAEKNLTYEREASSALDAVDRKAPPRSLSSSTPAASTKPGTSLPPAKSCPKNPPTFSPN